jgi:N-acetylneuraminic acid mutarotase
LRWKEKSCGEDNFSAGNKLLEYDPVTNGWTERAPFPGSSRSSAAGFVINNKAYVGTGFDSRMQPLKGFYEYDPASNTWSRKADFAGVERYASVGFAIGTKGYMGTGFNRDFLNDMWSYNLSTNQ